MEYDKDWEKKRAERIRRRKQQRIQQLRRNIFIGAGVTLCLFLVLMLGVKIVKGHKKDDSVKTASVTETAPAVEEVVETPVPEVTEEPAEVVEQPTVEEVVEAPPVEETAEQPPVEEAVPEPAPIPDRSNFAVDPNIPCGSDHNNGQNIVYFTIDDGPSYLTEQVLDIFDRYGVKATFFVTAQDPEYFYMIKEAYDRGHTIGLHSYTHDYATIYTSVDGYFEDLNRIGQVVQEQIGYVPCFIRFPGGEANMVSADYCPGIMSQLVQEVNARGYQYYNWNISSGDGGNIDDPAILAANATACDYPNIILLSHDSGGKESTVAALPAIIEHYQSLGYEFRALDRDTFCCHAEVRN